ncbi:MAG TPA: hypothetical protein VGO63_02800 [Candidatus Paceibacterota bacterium]|jgi:hypothetical protein|nr:hypothetical protein [Candidatus Paceibacterota bacterium]
MDNSNNEVDLLQIRIENAKAKLPVETTNAIAAVDWKAAIVSLREKKGYNFEQLGDLELETELLLCGLTTPEEYPKELQTRMRISKAETDELVNEMNSLVFNKIKEELIKNSERKRIFEKNAMESGKEETAAPISTSTPRDNITKKDSTVLKSAGIEIQSDPIPVIKNESIGNQLKENREDILKKIENPENIPTIANLRPNDMHPLLAQKILGSVQAPIIKTEHTIENISKGPDEAAKPTGETGDSAKSGYKVDPYRMLPE